METVTGEAYEITASSILDERSEAYGPAHLADLDPATAWCEGSPGTGSGQWLQVDLKSPSRPAALEAIHLKLLPGHTKSGRLYKANARPSRFTLGVTDRATGGSVTRPEQHSFNVLDKPSLQVFSVPVGGPVGEKLDPSKLRLHVKIEGASSRAVNTQICALLNYASFLPRETEAYTTSVMPRVKNFGARKPSIFRTSNPRRNRVICRRYRALSGWSRELIS